MLSTFRRQKILHHWQTNQQDCHAHNTWQKLYSLHGSSNHKQNENKTECKIPEHHFLVVYTKLNEKLTWALFSTSLVVAHVHLPWQLQSKTISSPHGQDSPNNASKNTSQNPRQQQKDTFGNPPKENSQRNPGNQRKRLVTTQLALTLFLYRRPI